MITERLGKIRGKPKIKIINVKQNVKKKKNIYKSPLQEMAFTNFIECERSPGLLFYR